MESLVISKNLINPVENYSTGEVYTFMKNICASMCELFKKKDIGYGGSWQNRGVLSAQLNLERKMDRVKSQFDTGKIFEHNNVENIADTLIDNAVYSLMYLWFLSEKDTSISEFLIKFMNDNS
jgi:hypothetical protein